MTTKKSKPLTRVDPKTRVIKITAIYPVNNHDDIDDVSDNLIAALDYLRGLGAAEVTEDCFYAEDPMTVENTLLRKSND